VYIPCRDYGRYLPKAIESVLAQLYSNWELLIIDEASSDNTADVAEQYSGKHPDKIKLTRNRKQLGLQRVANHVLGLANGKYIMRLDADDWLDEGALLLMVAKFESNTELGLVFGNYYYTNPDGDVIGVERRDKLGRVKNVAYHPPHGACTMVKTRALKRVGGYSEDINAQDGWELWYKFLREEEIAHLETPLFYYRQHDTSLSRDARRLLDARAQIFERAAQGLKGEYIPSCLAVIGARESYPGFTGVPYIEHEGRSLLARALDSAVGSEAVSEIVVSSESQQVLDYSESLERDGQVGRHRRVAREGVSTPGLVPIREILLHAGEVFRQLHGKYPDIVAFLSIHAIGRTNVHVSKALNVLRVTGSDSVVSVCEEREPLFRQGQEGLRLLNPGRLKDLSYDRERLYSYNGGVIAVWWEILTAGELLGNKIGYIEMSAEDSVQIKRGFLR